MASEPDGRFFWILFPGWCLGVLFANGPWVFPVRPHQLLFSHGSISRGDNERIELFVGDECALHAELMGRART